jgi:hypothetical protein
MTAKQLRFGFAIFPVRQIWQHQHRQGFAFQLASKRIFTYKHWEFSEH